MSFEAARKLIAAVADALDVGIPVEWENATPQKAVVWGRWVIQHTSAGQAIIGPGHVRSRGILYLQIFVGERLGVKPVTVAADIVAEAFDRRQMQDGDTVVTMDTFEIFDAGARDGYTQKNLACSFTRDTYRVPADVVPGEVDHYFVSADRLRVFTGTNLPVYFTARF